MRILVVIILNSLQHHRGIIVILTGYFEGVSIIDFSHIRGRFDLKIWPSKALIYRAHGKCHRPTVYH